VDQAFVFTHYLLLITHYSKAVLKGQGFRPNYEGKLNIFGMVLLPKVFVTSNFQDLLWCNTISPYQPSLIMRYLKPL
jgi:hypothetical protein